MELRRARGVQTVISFPLVDADGDFVTGATGLDSEVDGWSDGGVGDGFTDCTNEAAEVGTTGWYDLTLTAAEMAFDYVRVQVKSSAKPQAILITTTARPALAPMNYVAQVGETSRTVHVRASDIGTGRPKTGLVFNTSGLAASYARSREARVAITLATQTVTGAYSSGGFVEIDATNLPGWYRFDPPNAALATGAVEVNIDFVLAGTEFSPVRFDLLADNVYAASTAATQASVDLVQTDVDDIQARLPAALVSGRVDASVGAMAAGVVTAAAVATDAIDADALAADAVTEIWGQAGADPTSVPAVTASRAAKLDWLFALARNTITQTSTTQLVKADDGTTTIGTSTVSDNGTTATRGEFA